jgi:hypothetical protein
MRRHEGVSPEGSSGISAGLALPYILNRVGSLS